MPALRDLLVCGCRDSDLAVLRECIGPGGPHLRCVESPVEVARRALGPRPEAVVLGIGQGSLDRLELIRMVRKLWPETPTIVIAEDDSLELERSVREAGIFYYVVHPLERGEARAVLDDVSRRTRRGTPPPQRR